MRRIHMFAIAFLVPFICGSQGSYGLLPVSEHFYDKDISSFADSGRHRFSPHIHNSYLTLPKEAPLDYYSKKHMREWYVNPITMVNGWIRLWLVLKIDHEHPDYFSDILIFITDDRTGAKYGKARIIATQHRVRTGGVYAEETIFCAHDKSYLDSVKEEFPDWRIVETNNSDTCRDALDQIIERMVQNAGDNGWTTQNIHDLRVV